MSLWQAAPTDLPHFHQVFAPSKTSLMGTNTLKTEMWDLITAMEEVIYQGTFVTEEEQVTLPTNFSPPGSVGSILDGGGPYTPGMLSSPGELSEDGSQERGGNQEDGSDDASKRKGKVSRKESRVCSVCGDIALGYNFEAISCESCKAFFRRNALKTKKTRCVYNNKCKIDVITRKFCPHCRLNKCLEAGMKKELILGEAARKQRMEKVATNRVLRNIKGVKRLRRKATNEEVASIASVSSPEPTLPASPPQTFVMSNSPMPSPAPSSCPVTPAPVIPLATIDGSQLPMLDGLKTETESLNGSTTSSVTTDTATCNLLSFMDQARVPGTLDASGSMLDQLQLRELSAVENSLIMELKQVYDLSFTTDLEPLIHIKQLDPSLNQLINQSSITVLRIIKFAKRLEEFSRLPQECQIGILKGSWIHILLLRSVSAYDVERDMWVTPRGEIPTTILKNATGFVKLHEDHRNYCKSIKLITNDDLLVVILLLIIVLFSPEGAHVTIRELISNIQDKYLLLLKHYLESKYTYSQAASIYPILINKMKELKDLADTHGKYLLDVNPREIEPIMLEILDLK